MISLRRRLLWILLGLILVSWLAMALVVAAFSRQALQEQVDQQLQQYLHVVNYISRVFARQIDEGLPLYETWSDNSLESLRRNPLVVPAPDDSLARPVVNIWLNGRLIGLLEGSPRFDQPRQEGFSFIDTPEDGGHWRLLTRYDPATELWIRVGVEFGQARGAMLGTLGSALLPLLGLLPLTLLVLYLGITRGLAPLDSLARQIRQRRAGQLDPVQTDAVPRELSVVVDAINRLLERLTHALEGEQRLTANAAHELMTPLAAIKAEMQLCQRQLHDGPAAGMLDRMAQRVDRASHSVEQLLLLARLDPDAEIPRQPVALRELLAELLAETGHLAANRGLSVNLEDGPGVTVHANPEALAIMLRNLLVNAFRYASDQSEVRITLAPGAEPELAICNDCAPLSAAEFEQVCARFYRVPGSTGLGAGLGLSIVQRVAQLHGARFSAGPHGPGERGFCAVLHFSPQERASG